MFARSDRLKELFRAELSQALRGVKDPGLSGLLTLTDLNLSPDKKTLFVYYSILGSERQRASASKALERASPYLRQVLRKRVTLKMIPQIKFIYDETPQKAARIDKVLLKIEAEEQEQ